MGNGTDTNGKSGCVHGRATRTILTVVISLFVTAVLILATVAGSAWSASASNRENLARLEERLKAIDDTTKRIESAVATIKNGKP